MKNYHCLIILLLFGIGVRLAAQDGVSQSRWQPVKVTADGTNSEWKKPLNLYDAVTGLLFTIANDSSNLYLCFTANDERKVIKLMKAGWSVAIYSKEKNKKFNAVITLPAVPMISAPGKDEGIAKSEEANFKNEVALYRLNLQTVKTAGFVSANGDISVTNTGGINIGVGSDTTQEIIYEMAIPFKEMLPGNNLALLEEMGLHITVNALKKPPHHVSTDGSSSFNGTGAGRPASGKHGSKGASNADNTPFPIDRSLLFTEIDFEQKFRLENKGSQ